jgi:hypothetical protein
MTDNKTKPEEKTEDPLGAPTPDFEDPEDFVKEERGEPVTKAEKDRLPGNERPS